MAKQVRYAGEFLSRKGVTWRVEIWQEADEPFAVVGDLSFDAEQALVIEWEAAKTDTIVGSTATLKVQSPTDRAYIDLYTIAVGQIRMDVYREDDLYWRGCLDPEFYEEPYEMLDHYTVTLTFSDFGILDRLAFTRTTTGTTDLQTLVQECLDRAALEYKGWVNIRHADRYPDAQVIEYISTTFEDGGSETDLSTLSVRNANFYDEEGEASTLKEVVEGILQPLALHIRQYAGRIYIFDFNSLCTEAPVREVVWTGDQQTLGTDSVYNKLTITWSPYIEDTIYDMDEVWPSTYEIDETLCPWEQIGPETYDNSQCYGYDYNDGAYTVDPTEAVGTNGAGFSLWVSWLQTRAFKTVPFFCGEEMEGFILRWVQTRYDQGESSFAYYSHGLSDTEFSSQYAQGEGASPTHNMLFAIAPTELPVIDNAEDYAICLSLDMQIAATSTPWHDLEPEIKFQYYHRRDWGGEYDSATNALKRMLNIVLIPIDVFFVADDGTTYQWQNVTDAYDVDGAFPAVAGADIDIWKNSLGKWVSYEQGNYRACLAYYNNDSTAENGAPCVASFGTNRQFVGLTQKVPPAAKETQGQFIAYPDVGQSGTLYVNILSGWRFFTWQEEADEGRYAGFYDFCYADFKYNTLDFMRWVLCKAPTVEITKATMYDRDLDTDDVEYSAVINPDAADDLDINTICGTDDGTRALARGAYFSTRTGMQVLAFTRAGITATCEELLIGTIYSQFAERHTTLAGEAAIDGVFGLYTDANQSGDTLFFPAAVAEDVIEDTADITMIELSPDEYQREEE